MPKKIDPDVAALIRASKALEKCTSPKMVKATLDYLTDRYITHPSEFLPDHLKPKTKRR